MKVVTNNFFEDMMSTIAELAEQHIRESEIHLRHIDELMASVLGGKCAR